jgi:hypothetical protein
MLDESWTINDNKLVVYYTTFSGRKGQQIFDIPQIIFHLN